MTSADFHNTPESFELLYQKSNDPWNFNSSEYEQSRYAAMDTSLGLRRFTNAFEPACSIGAFTQRLSLRCQQVVACDAAPTAVALARKRCKTLHNVDIVCAELPRTLPEGHYDLIVLAECGYYFPAEILRVLIGRLAERLLPDGVLLGCHSLQTWPEHKLSGDEVHQIIGQQPQLLAEQSSIQPEHALYRLDLWRKLR